MHVFTLDKQPESEDSTIAHWEGFHRNVQLECALSLCVS